MKSPRPPRTVSATQFKAHCLALMDEVQQSGEEIVITKHGKPVARLAPTAPSVVSMLGWMRGTSEVIGDIVGPEDDWDLDAPVEPRR